LPDERLRVRSDDVLAMLRRDEPGWESYVEPDVAAAIKQKGLFGYSPRSRDDQLHEAGLS
jgi:hypothetical protein